VEEGELAEVLDAGLEVALHIPLQTLDSSLRLRVSWLAEIPVEAQLATQPGRDIDGGGWPACRHPSRSRTVSRASPPPCHKQRPMPTARLTLPWRESAPPLQRRNTQGRTQRPTAGMPGRDRPALARRSPTHPTGRSPSADRRPLIRARALEQWAHLPQIVVDDRLAAIEPRQLDQLTDLTQGMVGSPRRSS
jgi:hypothetical protein